mmetsp:Transcript_20947/g.53094  ORF Transcript_20947/g.53094 Transcript_20947/m.53094 type:complete len:209 (+) Transcript_20947:565-1191(+)
MPQKAYQNTSTPCQSLAASARCSGSWSSDSNQGASGLPAAMQSMSTTMSCCASRSCRSEAASSECGESHRPNLASEVTQAGPSCLSRAPRAPAGSLSSRLASFKMAQSSKTHCAMCGWTKKHAPKNPSTTSAAARSTHKIWVYASTNVAATRAHNVRLAASEPSRDVGGLSAMRWMFGKRPPIVPITEARRPSKPGAACVVFWPLAPA